MSEKLSEVYIANPITTVPDGGLIYVAKPPYGNSASQCAIKYEDLKTQTLTGTGNVVGPVSSTNNAPAIFDGTTGKLIKNSSVMTTGQVLGGVSSSTPQSYTLIAGTNMSSIVPDAKAQTITFNAANSSSIIINTRIFSSAQGNDSTGDGSFNKPFRTIVKSLSVSFPGDAIVMLNNFTDGDISWLPNRYLINNNGFPTLTCNSFNLDPTWGNASTFFVLNGVNITSTTAMNWDNSTFDSAFNYTFKFLNCTLTCSSGFSFIGLSNKSKLILNNVDTASNNISICDITLNKGVEFNTSNCNLGTIFIKCDADSATTSVDITGGSLAKNGSNQGIIGYSPLISVSNATVSININNLSKPQLVSPQLITLHQSGQTNILTLNQDSDSYKIPSVSGSGIAGIEYFLIGSGSSDSMVYDGNNTLQLSTFNNFNPAADDKQSITTNTQAMKGLDNDLLKTITNVYFSAFGSNVTSARAETNPALTLKYLLSQITDASIFKVYNAYRQGDVDEPIQVPVKPWINIISTDECQLELTDALILDDAYWDPIVPLSEYSLTINNHSLISATSNSINFDFSGYPSATYTLNLINLKTFGKNINIIGRSGLILNIINIDQSLSPLSAGVSELNITNCDVRLLNTINHIITFTANDANNYSIEIENARNYSSITINSDGSGIVTYKCLNSPNTNQIISATTGALNSSFDVASATNIATSGPVATPVLLTSSIGLIAGFTPSNYTPIDPSTQGHLKGIDNKFGAISSIPLKGNLYGFPISNSATSTQLNVLSTTEMSATSASGDFEFTPENTTLVVDNTISGIGGLDTGTVAVNTLYNVFLIGSDFDPITFTPALILSLSDTPDLSSDPDYDRYRKIGSWKTKVSSTDFVLKTQSGWGIDRWYDCIDAPAEMLVLDAQSDTTLTEIPLSPFTASTSTRGILSYVFNSGVAVTNSTFSITPHSNVNLTRGVLVTAVGTTSQLLAYIANTSSQSIDYVVSNALNVLTLLVVAYDEQL